MNIVKLAFPLGVKLMKLEMYGPSPFFCYSSCFLIRLVHANAQLIVGEYFKFYFNYYKIVLC